VLLADERTYGNAVMSLTTCVAERVRNSEMRKLRLKVVGALQLREAEGIGMLVRYLNLESLTRMEELSSSCSTGYFSSRSVVR
jgi:hypothetical protein